MHVQILEKQLEEKNRNSATELQRLNLQGLQLKAELLEAQQQCAMQQAEIHRLQVLSSELDADAQAMVKMLGDDVSQQSGGGSIQRVQNPEKHSHRSSAAQLQIQAQIVREDASIAGGTYPGTEGVAVQERARQACMNVERCAEGTSGTSAAINTAREAENIGEENWYSGTTDKCGNSYGKCSGQHEYAWQDGVIFGAIIPKRITKSGVSASKMTDSDAAAASVPTEHPLEQRKAVAQQAVASGLLGRAARAASLHKEVESLDKEIADLQHAFAAALPAG